MEPTMDRRQFLNQSNAVAATVLAAGTSLFGATQAVAATNPSNGNKIMNSTSSHVLERLTRENAVLLLVDHQVGLYTGVRDIDTLQLKHNVVGLAKAALALKVPVIVTTTTEKMWGPMIPELAEALPGIRHIERTTVNAWDDRRVVDAIKATGRKKLIITGISTDVCLAFPAISAIAEGYSSYAVIDASGGFSRTQVDMGVLRMQQAGVIPVGYSNVAVEMLADNAAPEAQAVYTALGIPFAGLVFDLKQAFSKG
ncbi:isochorismatase family protein [Paraburkholderia sp. DGU8]|jgi:nicotinamidase-related amidase|uniref:isochorismatase family protein n=1 Tax=Paraburkholderia sp. DGU8 TaxID=3161997 RepID=UPI003465478E